jgi:hypothetical protein
MFNEEMPGKQFGVISEALSYGVVLSLPLIVA